MEGALRGLKDSAYRESGARREAEHRLQTLQAEAKGAALREAELQKELQEAQQQVCGGRGGGAERGAGAWGRGAWKDEAGAQAVQPVREGAPDMPPDPWQAFVAAPCKEAALKQEAG